jgi:hypothetical protein
MNYSYTTLIALGGLFFGQPAFAEKLITEHYIITIDSKCPEGEVTCDKVYYQGVNKKTGQSIKLKGKTLHTKCADGATPCRFIGYVFKNGNIIYEVSDDGASLVKEGKKNSSE